MGITRGARLLGERGCFEQKLLDLAGSADESDSTVSLRLRREREAAKGCRHELTGELAERSCRGGRPGIVAVLLLGDRLGAMGADRANLRESMATSCKVVMGASSGTLTFLLRVRLCSLILSRRPLHLSALSVFSASSMGWPSPAAMGSGSGCLAADDDDKDAGCFSLGNS